MRLCRCALNNTFTTREKIERFTNIIRRCIAVALLKYSWQIFLQILHQLMSLHQISVNRKPV